MIKHCPNKACIHHKKPGLHWFVKNGTYKPKNTQQKTPRYRCKTCGKSFSTHTFKSTVNQKKPEINVILFKLLVSGVSLRRASQILEVKYDTVVRHFRYLSQLAQKRHQEFLLTVKTSFVQVDELETFIHARPMAVTVPMVVRVKTGQILGFAVAKISANGPLAAIGKSLYHWTTNQRASKFKLMIKTLKPCFKTNITFKCDSYPSYPNWINGQLPESDHHVTIQQVLGAKKKTPNGQPKPFDELFTINNTFARMRHDLNRLARKTWSTTKNIEGLEDHLWLYVAWNNGYQMK